MLCCELDLPEPFTWRIKAVGKCAELLDSLQNIMRLAQCSEDRVQLTVMPRSYYDSLPKSEYSSRQMFYSRKAVRLFHRGNFSEWFMVLPENILSDKDIRVVVMWLMMRPFYLHCLSNGGLPVHASSADLNGRGIIVAAMGDTGKTTTVRRLPEPWQELADDTALLLPDNNGFRLHPLPTWSEFIHGRNKSASWDIKKSTKLSGIFFLEQSKHDKADRLSLPLSMMSLYQSSMEALGELEQDISNELKAEIFETAVNITTKVPSFSLYATLSGKVCESIESALTEEQWK
ncbi:MAG: SynChlorMet cassette protein ScmC [Victivallaceae bacterium]|nr:SynChlorMet cassette protein ScmC [Victivallaceae bacterium]